MSLYFNDNLELLSGEKVQQVLQMIREHNPLAIGFNCIQPQIFTHLMREIRLDYNWGFYLNCGSGNLTDREIKCGISPTEYWKIIASYLNKNPAFIGSCCGSSPEHIKKLKIELNG